MRSIQELFMFKLIFTDFSVNETGIRFMQKFFTFHFSVFFTYQEQQMCITLVAVVLGNEVSNEFTVTKIYQQHRDDWKLLDLTFSSVRDSHSIEQ